MGRVQPVAVAWGCCLSPAPAGSDGGRGAVKLHGSGALVSMRAARYKVCNALKATKHFLSPWDNG